MGLSVLCLRSSHSDSDSGLVWKSHWKVIPGSFSNSPFLPSLCWHTRTQAPRSRMYTCPEAANSSPYIPSFLTPGHQSSFLPLNVTGVATSGHLHRPFIWPGVGLPHLPQLSGLGVKATSSDMPTLTAHLRGPPTQHPLSTSGITFLA